MIPNTPGKDRSGDDMSVPEPMLRRSPIHHLLAARRPEWGTICKMQIAVRFQATELERDAMSTLAVCDASGLLKLGIKGGEAESLLVNVGVSGQAVIYETATLTDGGLIARLGADEFFLESGVSGETAGMMRERLSKFSGRAFAVERQEATFMLFGSRSGEVLAQTCGLDMSAAVAERYLATRVAAVNCGVLPSHRNGVPLYRFWVDYSFAESLWDSLATICDELGGSIIGVGCVWPEQF